MAIEQQQAKNRPSGATDTTAEQRLLLHAAWQIRRRSADPAGYGGLSSDAATDLADQLELRANCASGLSTDAATLAEMLAQAHRVLDDDSPDLESVARVLGQNRPGGS
jgi:hypothetical protein